MTSAAPLPIAWHASLPSTNTEAMRRAAAGETGPLWIAAERQTAGRGRSERNWRDHAGNLAATLIWPTQAAADAMPQLSLVAGVALYDAVSRIFERAAHRPASIALKWPNDLLIDDAKVAGILVEATSVGGKTLAVMGFGVNLAAAPALPDRPTTALSTYGIDLSPRAFLGILSQCFADRLELWNDGQGFEALRSDWLSRAIQIGSAISVHDGTQRLEGHFRGLDSDGALLLTTTDDTVRRLINGDVVLKRQATAKDE